MTETMASMPPPDDMHSRRDPSEPPERPGTIPWELLGASDYRSTIEDLGSWLAWLVPVYRIPPSVIPPCWFLHTGLIEELGHLWTGWQVTRHPESGLGMVGLEWDNHRERVTSRLRELVAIAGCNGTTHSAKPGPILNRDDKLWEANLQSETTFRTNRSAEQAFRSAALGVLLKAEQRNELALDILRDIAADPAHPTAAEIRQATIALEKAAQAAPSDAQMRGREARAYLGDAACESRVKTELAAARDGLLTRIVADRAGVELEDVIRRWHAAATSAAPTDGALRRAAAANAGRSAAVNHPASAKCRPTSLGDLQPPSTTLQ